MSVLFVGWLVGFGTLALVLCVSVVIIVHCEDHSMFQTNSEKTF